MTRIFTLIALFCAAFNLSAQSATTLTFDNAQAAYMGSYTQQFGEWGLILADGDEVVAGIQISNNSAKRLAGDYSFTEGNIVSAYVTVDGEDIIIADGHYTLSFARKGDPYPYYHIQGELTDEADHVYQFDTDIEMLAYDYLYYLYYEMGIMPFESCVVMLQDAPDEDTGVVVDIEFVGGNWEDLIDSMGLIKVTAETDDARYTQLLFDATAIESGHYVLNDLYASYCYIANLETQTYEAYFKSGSAEITVRPDGHLALTATLRAKNDDIYNLTIPLIVPDGEDFREYLEGIHSPLLSGVATPSVTKTLRNGRITIHTPRHNYNTNGQVMSSRTLRYE